MTVILNGTQWSEESPTKRCNAYSNISFWKALPWRISTQASILWGISHLRSRWQTMSFWRSQGGRISTQAVANISIKVNKKKGIPRRAYTLARNDITVILNGTQWSEESPSNGIRKFLAFARNDNHLGSLTLGLSASVNFIFSFRASAVPEQECFVRHLAWCRFDKTYFCAGAAVKNFSLHVHARRPAKQFRWRILLYTRIAVKERTSPLFLCGKEERFICLLRFYMISSFPYRR